jgi:AcrR family transcriptional regulator
MEAEQAPAAFCEGKQLSPRCAQITAAAIELLSEGGITALTIKNLAQAVGVSEPALYRHFENKQGILVAILDRFDVHMRALFEEALNGDAAVPDQIQAVYACVFRNFATQPGLASVVFAEEVFRHDKRLAERVAQIMDFVEGQVLNLIRSQKGRSEIRNDVPAKDLARVIVGSLRYLVTRWCLSGYAFDLEKEGMAFWQSLRRMLSVPIT